MVSNLMDSIVYYSKPCIKSITKMAKSQRLEPLDLKLAKDSCPGVSITKRPGAFNSVGKNSCNFTVCSKTFSQG